MIQIVCNPNKKSQRLKSDGKITGSLCLIDLCRYANYGYDQRMEAFGPKGMICAENMKPNVAVVSDASGASV